MTKKEKLLDKAKNSPKNLTFNEFKTLLEQHEWTLVNIKGSHHSYVNKNIKKLLSIQPNGNNAKEYQIKQFLKYLQKEL
jgi:predicted RNA binding protein YcfA (HicA-like mRNA interferase family)